MRNELTTYQIAKAAGWVISKREYAEKYLAQLLTTPFSLETPNSGFDGLRAYWREKTRRNRAKDPVRTAELAKKHSQQFRDRHPERARELDRNRYQRDKIKRRQANVEYLKRTDYERVRRKTDPQFRFKSNLSRYVRSRLKGIKKCSDFISLLGCSIPELRLHLETKFKPGMTWKNYGFRGWHIDHKFPCSKFDLTDPEQQKQCFHFSNLQPLWAAENMQKHNKVYPESVRESL